MHVLQEQKRTGESDTPVENKAFSAQLYQRYAPTLLVYAGRHIPSRYDAEDLVLDVFLAALEHAVHLEKLPEYRQRAWLWTVARNRVVDYYRLHRRRPQVPLEYIAEMEDRAHTPEQVALRGEEEEQLRRWMHKLSLLQQKVLVLRFTGDLPCAEIAIVMHKQEGAIRALLSRALTTLRRMSHE